MEEKLKKDFQDFYNLGYKNGYEMAKKEAELKKLTKEVEELKEKLSYQ